MWWLYGGGAMPQHAAEVVLMPTRAAEVVPMPQHAAEVVLMPTRAAEVVPVPQRADSSHSTLPMHVQHTWDRERATYSAVPPTPSVPSLSTSRLVVRYPPGSCTMAFRPSPLGTDACVDAFSAPNHGIRVLRHKMLACCILHVLADENKRQTLKGTNDRHCGIPTHRCVLWSYQRCSRGGGPSRQRLYVRQPDLCD